MTDIVDFFQIQNIQSFALSIFYCQFQTKAIREKNVNVDASET